MTSAGVVPSSAATVEDTQTPDQWIDRFLETQEVEVRRDLLLAVPDRADVEPLLSALKEASLRHLSLDPRRALFLADTLVEAAELARLPDHGALGLMAKGDALRVLGHYPESLALLEEAGNAFLAQGNELGWARTRIGWLVSVHRLGRAHEALAIVERARDVLVRHKEWLRAGGLDLNTAVVCEDLGLYERALDLYERAQREYESAGTAAGLRAVWSKANKAILLTLLGEFEQALTLHVEAQATFQRHGETMSVLREQQNIAFVYAGQGQHTRALRLLGDALDTATQSGLEANAASITLNMVECYLSLNRNEDASVLAQDAVERYQRCGAPTDVARAQYLLAFALARHGMADRALILLDKASESFAAAGLTRQRGLAMLQRAALHQRADQWPEALAAAEGARAVFSELGLPVPQAQAEIALARASLALGRLDDAAQLAQRALAMTEERSVPWLAHEGHHVLGRVAGARGDIAGALTSHDAAIRSIERSQTRLATELRSTFLEDKLQIYEDAIDCCLRLNQPRQAFAYLERAKSRALVDYLAGNPEVRLRAPSPDDQALVDELTRLRSEHNWFYERAHGAGYAMSDTNAPAGQRLLTLRAGLAEREKLIARVLERLALRRADVEGLPAVSAGRVDSPPSIELPRLDAGTILLEYFFGQERSAVFVVCDGEVTAVPLTATSRSIGRLQQRLQLNFASTALALASGQPIEPFTANAQGVLEGLYQALIAPAAHRLNGRSRLVVIPYGISHAVPFHALNDGQRSLIERMEVSVCPSSSLLQLCASRSRRASGSALIMAYSDGGRLRHVQREADLVSSIMPGECFVEAAATRAALVEAAPRHAIVHLAAHGEARLDNPAFAYIKLADGHLSTADVFNLPLDGALVTLSACETGRSVVRGGDEIIGLSRGFLYAGVSTLVQSLWRVEDETATVLMERFYSALQGNATPAAALREAQCAFLSQGSRGSQRGRGGQHPFLWAPFQLAGDGGHT